MVNKLTITNLLEPFLSNLNKQLHLAKISKDVNQPHPTVRLGLNYLETIGILKKQFTGRLTLYGLNLDHQNLLDYLVMAEKNRLIARCEQSMIIKEIVGYIHNSPIDIALFFGSAVDNASVPSDFDILVVRQESGGLKKLEDRLNIVLHIITLKSLDDISESLKNEISKKHLLVNGSEKVLRWLLWQH